MLILKYVIIIALFGINHSFSADESDAFDLLEFRNKGRLKAFNIEPDSANKIDEEWWGLIDKTLAIMEYTSEIDESLFDDSELLFEHAINQKTELLLKTIMGSAITDQGYMLDESDFLSTGQHNSLFPYYKLVTQASGLLQDLLAKIRTEGYTPINISDLDCYENKYSYLFTYCGVPRNLFPRWFNEVFKEHEPGFRMQNPGLSIHSYDPTNTRVRFDPRCSDPASCDHSELFEILDEEIEACYGVPPGNPFRSKKPKSASEQNSIGNQHSRALGRRFGNPDAEGLSSGQKRSIKTLICRYLNALRSKYQASLASKQSCYLEVDLGETATGLSKEASDALNNMLENSKSERF